MEQASLKLVSEAYDLIWNAKFDQAESLLEPVLKKHPIFPLLYCEIACSKYFLSEQKPDYEIVNRRVSGVRKDCQALYRLRKPALKQYLSELPPLVTPCCSIKVDYDHLPQIDCSGELLSESGANLKHVSSALWARSILAELSFMDAVTKFREQKYVKGSLDLKKSWDYYKECGETFNRLFQTDQALKQVPQLAEIRCLVDFGVATFHFMCSVVPKHFQFIIEGLGFKGDRILALEEFKRSMRCEPGVRSHVAALALSWIYAFFYYNYDVSNQILNLEAEQFPTSPVVLFTSGYVQRKQGNICESNGFFLKARDSVPSIPNFQLKVDYERGTNHYLLLEWGPARKLLTHFLDNNKSEAFRTYCAYQIAFCLIMMGQEDEATPYMRMVGPWVRKNYALDEYAGHQAKKYLKSGFSPFEITYQQAMISQEANNFQRVLDLLDTAKPQEETLADSARASQLRGSAYSHMKMYKEAKQCFMEVINQEKDVARTGRAMYALPFSYCGLLEIAIEQQDVVAGSGYVKKAKGFSGYEFETMLLWRLRKCEDDLRVLARES